MEINQIECFEIFPWDKNFEVGIDLIDEQHKKLVAILNKLAAHLANRSDIVILDGIFEELVDYTDYHFRSEEKIWESHFKDDEWYIKHEKTHESFIKNVLDLKKSNHEKPLDDVVQEIVSFLSRWLGYHILETDKRMALVVMALESGSSMHEAKTLANDAMSGSMKVLINTVLSMYDNLSLRTLDLMREKALRKQAEDALIASEERWEIILDDNSESIWDWNIENDLMYRSDHGSLIEDLFLAQEKNNKFLNLNDGMQIHPEDIKQVRADLQKHFNGETKFYNNKHRVRHKNGTWSWVSTRGKVVERNEDGTAVRMIGTHTDITERELGSLIFHHSNQAMLIADLNNEIININPAFIKSTGYKNEDIIGKNPSSLLSKNYPKEIYNEIQQKLEETGSWCDELYGQKINGEEFTALVNITMTKSKEKLMDHILILFSDITERKNMEAAMRQAQKMDAIGLLTAGISHDFNNLLAIILGNTELIENKITPDSKIYNSLQNLKDAGRRGAILIKQLLNYSRQQPKQITAFNINHLIEKLDSLIIRSVTPEIKVNMKFADELWLTNIDQSDFEEAIINMAINARDAITSYGSLIFETSNCVLDHEFCNSRTGLQPGKYVKLSISDNGSGIPKKELERIFEPFYTTKELGKGTGLGLAMVYSFAMRSNGYIDVVSKIGVGSIFSIYLPKTTMTEQVAAEEHPEKLSTAIYNGTILVVDDEPSLVAISKEVLTLHGYKVLSANNGKEALDLVSKEKDIDLLFSDVLMPGGMNGYELAQYSLNIQPNLKILLTTGHATQIQSQHEFLVLEKPYELNAMLSKIYDLLKQ